VNHYAATLARRLIANHETPLTKLKLTEKDMSLHHNYFLSKVIGARDVADAYFSILSLKNNYDNQVNMQVQGANFIS